MLETLKSFKAETGETKDLFVQQVAVLHANFKGKYGSVEQFKKRSDDEKSQYFSSALVVADPRLREVPVIKLAYYYYWALIFVEDEGHRALEKELRAAFRAIQQGSKFARRPE